jgi:glutamine synthetase
LPRRRSRRPRWRGARTTAPARCASSATAPGLRFENRLPGGDVNPYLAIAAIIASGLHGIDAGLELEPPLEGNAYESDKPRVPSTLQVARDGFAASTVAREAFGDDVVDHYLNMADVELQAFNAAVTDWERFRGFERL